MATLGRAIRLRRGFIAMLCLGAAALPATSPTVLPAATALPAATEIVPKCKALTQSEHAALVKEAASYAHSTKYRVKIKEARGERRPDARHFAIMDLLKQRVLAPGQSVLDLGCAAGAMLRQLHAAFQERHSGKRGHFAGVELTPGWTRSAASIFGNGTAPWNMQFYNADITDVRLGRTFDVILMNDVLEHVMPRRYGCLFATLAAHSHAGTAVYLHTPTPETQLTDAGQYFENVVPHHVLVAGMAGAGFQLEYFAYDLATDCGVTADQAPPLPGQSTANRGAHCVEKRTGFPKYSHALFRRAATQEVFRPLEKVAGVPSK
jgi:SAM-dependent methyltransferase